MYLGSKARLVKQILPIMLEQAKQRGCTTTWVEPFVGGGNVIQHVPESYIRIGIDVNPHTIAALVGIRDHINEFPTEVSEEYYRSLKNTPPDPITSWIRYQCSFGSRFENGYARNARNRNYCMEGRANLHRQSKQIQDVILLTGGYTICSHFTNAVIYCDPPYQQTTGYRTKDTFDHAAFWQWCRAMSTNNLVFVSEYNAPEDFTCIWEGQLNVSFSSQRTTATKATEKLFQYIR